MDKRCGWCKSAVGTTAKAYVYCQEKKEQVLREQQMKCFEREPGADDDKGEE